MRRALLLPVVVAVALAVAGSPAAAQKGAAPNTTTGPATNVAPNSATLTGWVNPRGTATSYRFQFGATPSYGRTTPTVSAGSGTTARAVSANATGLAAGTTYHYRIVATNARNQTRLGVDRTFTTTVRPSQLRLFGRTAFVGPGRKVGVFTGCFGGGQPCRGSLKMTYRGVTIGSRGSFFVKPASGGIVHVPLNSAGRRRLKKAHGRHFRATVTVSSVGSGSDTQSVTVVRYYR